MPAFDYACEACELINEIQIRIGDDPPKSIHCDECNGEAERIYSAPEVIFKGGGWPGVEAKCGERYRESRQQVERDEARDHERIVGEKEAEEVMKVRRQGKRASQEFRRRQPKKWARYQSNLRKGIGRNAGNKN